MVLAASKGDDVAVRELRQLISGGVLERKVAKASLLGRPPPRFVAWLIDALCRAIRRNDIIGIDLLVSAGAAVDVPEVAHCAIRANLRILRRMNELGLAESLVEAMVPSFTAPVAEENFLFALKHARNLDARLSSGSCLLLESTKATGLDHSRLRLILEHGANPHVRDALGRSAMHFAGQGLVSYPEAVRELIALLQKHGGQVDCLDASGATPLARWTLAKNDVVARALVEAGANVFLPLAAGRSVTILEEMKRLHKEGVFGAPVDDWLPA
jgi:ankyrin repeat protein